MNLKLRRFYHRIKHYFTLNNVVIVVGFLIAASWVWGSLQAMQRNYTLEHEVETKKQQLQIAKLQTENLQLEQNYYKTAEYQELVMRDSLGYAMPGEHQLILPANSDAAKKADSTNTQTPTVQATSNIEQWMIFLFGGAKNT